MPKDQNLVVKGETVLAFDFGLRKIGVAVGNTLTKTTMPLDIIYTKNGDAPWSDIENLLEEWKPLSVIVGDPINMDDTFSEMSGKAFTPSCKMCEHQNTFIGSKHSFHYLVESF